MSEQRIHPQAIIDPKAKLADDVTVGPWTLIGADVEIGAGSVIGPHVILKGPTKIGKNNKIFQFSSIGEDPQSVGIQDPTTRLEIGDDNIFREAVTIHRGTAEGAGVTKIGSNSIFMANAHVGHDSVVGDHVVFANNATIGGHVKIGHHVGLSGFTEIGRAHV